MWSSSCGKGARFCPFSFGLALGLTGAVMMLVWTAWLMYHGMPVGMDSQMMPASWGDAFVHAFWILVKGFVFGFVFAFIYNWIACWCKARCCASSKGECCDSSDKK